jgi:lysophospholipase L1-like esterase
MSSDPPKLEPDRKFEVTKTYAQTAVQVAKEEGVGLVDAWTALWDAAGHDEKALSNFSYDGLHLNSAGYEVRAEPMYLEPRDLY